MGEIMEQSLSKHIVYKYGGDPRSDDSAFDEHGDLNFRMGDTFSRHGISWKIGTVDEQRSEDYTAQIPILWVHLLRVLAS
jgi:hypothetical protein